MTANLSLLSLLDSKVAKSIEFLSYCMVFKLSKLRRGRSSTSSPTPSAMVDMECEKVMICMHIASSFLLQ